MPHTLPIRVYYEDTDAAGIVYYANYLRFAERARTEALRQAGFDHRRLKEEYGIAFVVRKMHADLRKPALLDDLLTIKTTLNDIGGASMEMRQMICRDEALLVSLDIRLAVIGPDLLPTRLPKAVRDSMQRLFISTSST